MDFGRSTLLLLVFSELITAFFPKCALARWKTAEDTDFSIESLDIHIHVQKSGLYEEVVEREALILKDNGRVTEGVFTLKYNPQISRVQVLKAETRSPESTYRVSPKMIEDKTLASSAIGFDDQRQLIVAFPNVHVGSRVYIKYKQTVHHVPYPGFYGSRFGFGWTYQKRGHIKVESALSLFEVVNDPDHVLKVVHSTNNTHQSILDITLSSPHIKEVADEPNAILDPKVYAWVRVASSRDWSDIVKTVLPSYEKILSKKLPQEFQSIADQARKQKDPFAQINWVTSLLAEDVRYLGDWRTLKGLHIPHELSEIAKNKFGDCKDFSAATTAILRDLGYDAQVAWIWRSDSPVLVPYDLPAPYLTNHAIVHVILNGKSLWIDPTNIASFAQGIPEDIMDRPALILSEKLPLLEKTNIHQSDQSGSSFSQEVDLSESDSPLIQGALQVYGQTAFKWYRFGFSKSPESIKYAVLRTWFGHETFEAPQLEGFSFPSRVVEELNGKFSYRVRVRGGQSTAGKTYNLDSLYPFEKFRFNPKDRVSDLLIGPPGRTEREIRLNRITPIGSESLDCSIDSAWAKASRKTRKTENGVIISDMIETKQTIIRKEDFQSADFSKFQRKLVNCFESVAVIYRPSDRLQQAEIP